MLCSRCNMNRSMPGKPRCKSCFDTKRAEANEANSAAWWEIIGVLCESCGYNTTSAALECISSDDDTSPGTFNASVLFNRHNPATCAPEVYDHIMSKVAKCEVLCLNCIRELDEV